MPSQPIGPETAQAISYARNAGFTGLPLVIIVAIARAESGLNTQARNVNSDGSIDRGILQINDKWHREIPDSCAYDPQCSFRAAYAISNGGTNFNPWVTYKTGAYAAYASYTGQLAGVSIPDNLKKQEVTSQNNNLGPIGGAINAVGGALDSATQLIQFFQQFFQKLPSYGVHIALFAFALFLVIVGMIILTKG